MGAAEIQPPQRKTKKEQLMIFDLFGGRRSTPQRWSPQQVPAIPRSEAVAIQGRGYQRLRFRVGRYVTPSSKGCAEDRWRNATKTTVDGLGGRRAEGRFAPDGNGHHVESLNTRDPLLSSPPGGLFAYADI